MDITFDIRQIFPKYILNDRNGYALAKAIEKCFRIAAKAAEDGINTILDPDKMPEWRLDELAREYNCLYDFKGTLEQKRGWIKNAPMYFSKHGTPEGIRQYLGVYFGEAQILEWFENNLTAGYFDVQVMGVRSDENEAWIRAAVEKAKNVRSVLNNIIYNGGECEAVILAGAGYGGGRRIVVSGTML